MEGQNNSKEKSLLEKLKEKLNFEAIKNNSTVKKVVKGLTAISLATALAVLSSCSTQTSNPNNIFGNKDVTVTAPNGEQVNVSEYSQILRNVLQDSEINTLISKKQNNAISDDSPYFKGIPFAFIEEQGHDVEKVLSGEYKCHTTSYIKPSEPNNLYMMISVENAGEYYTQYLIRYTLTKQEISDYNLVYGVKGDFYYQAPFMNNAIAEAKQATILNVADIAIKAGNNLGSQKGLEGLKTVQDLLNTKGNISTILKDYDIKNQTFNVYVYSNPTGYDELKGKGKIMVLTLRDCNKSVKEENGVFMQPSLWMEFYFADNFSAEDIQVEDINVYSCSMSKFNTVNATNLLEELQLTK